MGAHMISASLYAVSILLVVLPFASSGLINSIGISINVPPPLPTSQSQPNPIWQQYGLLDVTATINSTIVVVPIPIAQARAIIPVQYPILTAAYHELLPGWLEDMYPLIVAIQLEHDIHGFGLTIPDFTTFRIAFPFVDILKDGYSNFVYAPVNWINLNPVGLLGLSVYGLFTPIASMDPPGDPYDFVPVSKASAPGEVYFNFTDTLNINHKTPNGYVKLAPAASDIPWNFIRNVTNQPFTGNFLICDNQIRIFNTSLTRSPSDPVPVAGSVFLDSIKYPHLKLNENDAKGWLFAAAFRENNFLPCSVYKGYEGTGTGDSL
ncbi:hypothetical protein EYR41_004664 [Orbilia oligospora]|uniref:Uncharacterized protein n=1 Tax=Orbilia oligospora TaxID=2813651 RepID=A0A7C8PL91_ORBOL|nr:hypothetical protein TWF751_011229 [Orbilia oligospora]TGJ72796.1 hypothetical protein EYR41_004664 [Orbilia oligospora]